MCLLAYIQIAFSVYNEAMRYLAGVLSVFFVFVSLLSPAPVYGIEFRGGENIRVEKDQIISESLFVGGNSVTIEGTVDGDLFCGGQNVVISGTVNGDVLCAGQNLRVSGTVNGNTRIAGQTVSLDGFILRNVNALGQTISIAPSATISGELLFGAQALDLAGFVGKTLFGGGQQITISGVVEGDVNVEAEKVVLDEGAQVAGALRYASKQIATIADSASVSGEVVRSEPKYADPEDEKRRAAPVKPAWPVSTFPAIVLHMILGCIVVALFPKYAKRVSATLVDNPVIMALKGALAMFVIPAASIILMITIIGIPAGLLGFILFGLALSVSRLFVALVVGEKLLEQFSEKNMGNLYAQVLVGVPVLWLLIKMPLLGGLLSFIVVIWGLGGVLWALNAHKR